jgi:integral membrane protein
VNDRVERTEDAVSESEGAVVAWTEEQRRERASASGRAAHEGRQQLSDRVERTEDTVISDEENPAQAVSTPGVRGALARFRVMAYVVGVGLLALCASMILNYGFDQEQYTKFVGPVHGFLYIGYFLATIDLALKVRWSVKRTILILLAGMVPFVSFIAERRVTRDIR